MELNLANAERKQIYSLLCGLIAPRPIALTTSLNAAGQFDAAPFRAFNHVGKPVDPDRAVQAIIKAVESAKPPRHFLLGKDAYEGAMAKPEESQKDFSATKQVARG